MEKLPLISIGVPTYNRPEGLKKALLAIIDQTYKNIEIIVSDNCSPGDEVSLLMGEFCKRDPRILFHRQEKNLGIKHNFEFLLEKATGNYFMWAADDDEWQGTDFLANLIAHAPSNILTFPDAVLSNSDGTLDFPLNVYENCESRMDYSKTFCSTGGGYPFYGLYNLPLFHQFKQKFQFDDDLKYYGEGTFIHKLFLAGPVKYIKEAKIKFSTASVKPSYAVLIDCFFEYFKRTVLIYSQSDLTCEEKTEIMNVIFSNYTAYLRNLVEKNIEEQRGKKMNGLQRVKKAIKILVTGNI